MRPTWRITTLLAVAATLLASHLHAQQPLATASIQLLGVRLQMDCKESLCLLCPSYGRSAVGWCLYILGVPCVAAAFVTYGGLLFGVAGLVLVGVGVRLSPCRWRCAGKRVASVTSAGLVLDHRTTIPHSLIWRAWLIPIYQEEADHESAVV